jgi:hypothetical protein
MDTDKLRHTLYESVNNLVDAIENAERIAADARKELQTLILQQHHENVQLKSEIEAIQLKALRNTSGVNL